MTKHDEVKRHIRLALPIIFVLTALFAVSFLVFGVANDSFANPKPANNRVAIRQGADGRWYAYVKAGEYLRVRVGDTQSISNSNATTRYDLIVIGPTMAESYNVVNVAGCRNAAATTICDKTFGPASEDGVWTIESRPAGTGGGGSGIIDCTLTDSDSDGFPDDVEISTEPGYGFNTDPFSADPLNYDSANFDGAVPIDTDGDDLPDAWEDYWQDQWENYFVPNLLDYANGIMDGSDPNFTYWKNLWEIYLPIASFDSITSLYSLPLMMFDKNNPDTNGNGVSDGKDNYDGDDLNNIGELNYFTNPFDPDTDGDGTFDAPGVCEDMDTSGGGVLFNVWLIRVQAGSASSSAERTGRVWTNRLHMYTTVDMATGSPLTLYAARSDGYIYRVYFPRMNGVGFALRGDSSGVVPTGSCTSAYRSSEQADSLYRVAPLSCGSYYRLYLQPPSSEDIPSGIVFIAQYSTDGTTITGIARTDPVWIKVPQFQDANVVSFSWNTNNDPGAPYAGTIQYRVNGFQGTSQFQISDSPSFTNILRSYDALVASSLDLISIDFDGKTGGSTPQIIDSSTAKLYTRILFSRYGEFHAVSVDIENRERGIILDRMVGEGSAANKRVIAWDDSFLGQRTTRCNVPYNTNVNTAVWSMSMNSMFDSQISAGIGAHRWNAGPIAGRTCTGGNTSGVSNRSWWGDVRNIDDWTWDTNRQTIENTNDLAPNVIYSKSITAADKGNTESRVNANFNYVITAINNGNVVSGPITITDTLDSVLQINSVSYTYDGGTYGTGTGNCSISGQTVSCTTNSLKSGPNPVNPEFPMVMTINVTPILPKNNILNTAYITGGDCTGTNCPTNQTTINAVEPTLRIAKSVSENIVRVGHEFTYTLTVTNIGNAVTMGNIVIRDQLDASFVDVSASISEGSCNVVNNNITCTSSKVLAYDDLSSNLVITIKAKPTLVIDEIPNIAYVTNGDDRKCPTGSTTCASENVIIKTVTPELHIVKTMDSGVNGVENFVVGRPGKYILTITNEGSIATSGTVYVSDDIPDGFTIGTLPDFCSAASQTITCTRTNPISVGGEWIIEIPVTPIIVVNDKDNYSYVWGGDDQICVDNSTASNTPRCNSNIITDLKHAELLIEKIVITPRVIETDDDIIPIILLGEYMEYVLAVTNIGNNKTLMDSFVVDYLPDSVVFIEESMPEDCWYTQADHTVTCLIPDGLEPDQEAAFSFTVRSRAIDGNVLNYAVVDGDDLDCITQEAAMNVQRCNSSVTVPAFAPKIVINKTSFTQSVTQNGDVVYHLAIRNEGNYSTVSAYDVFDELPSEVKFASVKVLEDAGLEVVCTNNGNAVNCSISAGLEIGAEVRIEIIGKAITPKAGVRNITKITGLDCDEDDEGCVVETICISQDQQWLSVDEEFNNPARCVSDTIINIDELPKPPESGIIVLTSKAVVTLLLFAAAAWLLLKPRVKIG